MWLLVWLVFAQAPPRADGGVWGQPNRDPAFITKADVDVLMWPIVERINRSGWIWTTESCQGHDDPKRLPMLGVVTNDAGRLFAILARLHAQMPKRSGESQDPQGWTVQLWQQPRVHLGAYQLRIVASPQTAPDVALHLFAHLAAEVTP